MTNELCYVKLYNITIVGGYKLANNYAAENRFVRNCITNNNYLITNHAWERMFTRKIRFEDVKHTIFNGNIVEVDTRNSNPRLVYNLNDNNVVVEVDIPSQCILITVEKVDWSKWERDRTGFIKRK